MNNQSKEIISCKIELAQHIIMTSQAPAAATAISEVQKADSGARLVKKLSFNEQLITIPMGYGCFLQKLKEPSNEPVFIRHMFPVMYIAESYFELLNFIKTTMAEKSDDEKYVPFAIQMRRSGKDSEITQSEFGKEITESIEEALIEQGYIHSHKNPVTVISIYIDGDMAYAGISKAADNISAYNGGAHRFKKDDGQISRAEFKLLEALEDFNISLPEYGEAIDLGAAPGGFCRILLDRGLTVTAVDPADMDDRLFTYCNGNSNESKDCTPKKSFIHMKLLAEKLYEASELSGKYDIMTNDMRLDIMESAEITNRLSHLLKPEGIVIMTLKLSDGNWLKKTKKALNILSRSYSILKARQLFNNRSEVTVLLKKF